MSYVRTKNNKIIDLSKYYYHYDINDRLWVSFDNTLSFTDCGLRNECWHSFNFINLIKKEDIVEIGGKRIMMNWKTIHLLDKYYNLVTRIWTFDGNNYTLAWSKENDKY